MLTEPEARSPSWVAPIVIGAIVTAVGTAVLWIVSAAGIPGVSCIAFCACASAFAPFGAVPVWIAFRRDPSLTAGQGFALAFIAVGLGAFLLVAALLASGWPGELDANEIRQHIEQAQREANPDQTMSEEQLQQISEGIAAFLPYTPAIGALLLTVFGGLAGMITASMLSSRVRSARLNDRFERDQPPDLPR